MADRGQAQGSLLDEALRSTTRAVASAPKVTLLLVLVVTGICVALTVCHLGFKTDRADLIDPNAPYQKRWLAYTQSFGTGSDIVVVVESDSKDAVRRAIDGVGDKLKRETDLFSNVLYRIEATGLRKKGLQFLPPDQLRSALTHLERYEPVFGSTRGWEMVRLEDLSDRVSWQLSRQNGSGGQTPELLSQAERLTDSLSRFVDDPRDFRSPWPEMFPSDPQFRQATDKPVYMLARDGTMGFIYASPRKAANGFDGATQAIDRLRAIAAEVGADVPEAKVTLTGIPVLESDEMQRSSYDMTIASGVSFIGVGLLLLIGFRGLRHPVLAMVMLGVGLAWAFGFATFSVGHLNILSVSFAAMLIGLGGDFAIHYLSRYLEERQNGLDLADALEATSVGIGSGLITASLTTALAFFCATFTQFLGVAELGIIAGGGILLCALATFIALPALIALGDEGVPVESLPRPFRASWLRIGTSKFPLLALLISGMVILGVAACAFRIENNRPVPIVKFDHNLLNLQAEGIESVEVLRRLFESADQSLLFAVSMADSPEEALALKAKFAALPTVARVEEPASRLPRASSDQTRSLVQQVRSRLRGLPNAAPRFDAPNPRSVGQSLERLYQTIRAIDHQDARRIAAKLDGFLDRLSKLPLDRQSTLLGMFQQSTAESLLMQFHVMAMASDPEPLTAGDLPPELTGRFISPQNKWLLQVYPKQQVWEFEPLSKFVSDLRTVDPDVTGTPLQNYEASRQVKRSYELAALYALVVICLVLLLDFLEKENKLLVLVPPLVVIAFTAMTLSTRGVPIQPMYLVLGYLAMVVAMAAVLDFRNLRDAALTLVPPIAAGGMTVGILSLLQQDFNAANLIVLPLILGIGVDNGVYVVHNCRSQRGQQFTLDASTAYAMTITSITNMVGFGSLMLAAHRGLFSVGLVLTVGVACT
ncbi:MAG: MMPL family transporter, partial [Planctomycetota bacterium]|nr:MMPL family transporter [Planctomycetota bacterium]